MSINLSEYIKTHKNRLLTLAVVFICMFMLFKGLMQMPQIQRNKAEISDIKEQIAYEQVRQRETDALSVKVGTDEYIEQVAKEKLGLVKSNSKIFVDVSQENRQ